ncbi:MAG: hypothetical protein IJK02_08450 [Clostridia bacterium]|nr:hypothetical protein [Clostridia bacterium]
MKTFKKFMVLLLVVCLLFSLSSCFFIAGKRSGSSSGGIFSSSTKNLVGSWQLVDGRTDIIAMTLYSDGTCTVTDGNEQHRTDYRVDTGTWEVTDNTLKILGPYGGQFFTTDNLIGAYSVSKTELRFITPIVDGEQSATDIVFQRVN